MKKEDLFACLSKASEAFEQRVQEAAAETDAETTEEDFELQMQEDELARIVAAQMGFPVEE